MVRPSLLGERRLETNSGNQHFRIDPNPQPPLHPPIPPPHHYCAPRRAIAGIGTSLGWIHHLPWLSLLSGRSGQGPEGVRCTRTEHTHAQDPCTLHTHTQSMGAWGEAATTPKTLRATSSHDIRGFWPQSPWHQQMETWGALSHEAGATNVFLHQCPSDVTTCVTSESVWGPSIGSGSWHRPQHPTPGPRGLMDYGGWSHFHAQALSRRGLGRERDRMPVNWFRCLEKSQSRSGEAGVAEGINYGPVRTGIWRKPITGGGEPRLNSEWVNQSRRRGGKQTNQSGCWGQPIRLVDKNRRTDWTGVSAVVSRLGGREDSPSPGLRIWVWNSENIQLQWDFCNLLYLIFYTDLRRVRDLFIVPCVVSR